MGRREVGAVVAALGFELDGQPWPEGRHVHPVVAYGRQAALRVWPADDDLEVVWASYGRAEALREAGAPLPELLAHGVVGGQAWALHERLRGTPVTHLRAAHLDALEALHALQVGAAEPTGAWADELKAVITTGLPGFARSHEPARSMDDHAAALLDEVRGVGRAPLPLEVPDGDVVHGDLHPGNLLEDADGRLVGVVDLGATWVGDAAFDWFVLDRSLVLHPGLTDEDGVGERLRGLLRRSDGRLLARYAAFLAVRYLCWSAETRPDELPAWAERVERHLATWWR
jgi:aminoglycoside phosphotransferase (APT) family kinase protein